MKKPLIWILLQVLFCELALSQSASTNLKLWYDKPAGFWVEALPLGNGRLGAMVFGIPYRERIQLNENTVWAGSPYRNDNSEMLQALPEIRQLIFDGKYAEAEKLACEKMVSKTTMASGILLLILAISVVCMVLFIGSNQTREDGLKPQYIIKTIPAANLSLRIQTPLENIIINSTVPASTESFPIFKGFYRQGDKIRKVYGDW
ncbi:MAG TPA: glycoside hydrolase N-terminal domain-containing protein, partial [Prolixibacteraceae bacterium]|nr:glycoside hydrolase N-terminal domain-containing protein [Prolixibacteraceae bacterium]